MLRRFESYTFHESTTPEEVADLTRVLLRACEFIPEVRYSAVGMNQSDVPVALVWEHAYEGPESYARYMCHPYHICMLDRYLLPESPECITASRGELGVGLFGYEIDGAPFRRDRGVRRIVAMKAARDVDVDAWNAFESEITSLPTRVQEMRASIVAPNVMGLEWFPQGWTHIWEQAYDDESGMRCALDHERTALEDAPVDGWVDLWYRVVSDTQESDA